MAGIHVPTTGSIEANDLAAIVLGAATYACGGGGSPAEGHAFADELADRMADRTISLVALDELPGEATVAVPLAYPRTRRDTSVESAVAAFRSLGQRGGPPFHAVLPNSLGVVDLLTAFGVALECGIPVVDASGGARPSSRLSMTAWAAAGVRPGLMVFSDGGEPVIVDSESVAGADRTVRSIVDGDTFAGPIGGAGWAMLGHTARRSSIAAAVSSAWDLGTELLAARADDADPIDRAVAVLDGAVVIGRGPLDRVLVALDDRHDHVEVRVSSADGMLDVLALDSYLEVRHGGRPIVGAPDLIMIVAADGTPHGPHELAGEQLEGMEMAVVAVPVPSVFEAPIVLDTVADLRRRAGGETERVPFPEASA